MGCCKGERKPKPVNPEHKFAYINLADFKSKSCLNYMAYFGIYSGTLISIACYVADMYTAVILLAYNRWSSEALNQSSVIDFKTAKIVFSTCIFLSFVLLVYDWWVAYRVIKSDGVADAYMNVIAVRFNCIWGGKGKVDTGWRRFLVFSRLTKSRGFVDYIAIFTYFAFKGWVRILFAEGPRVVINTLTFISVTKADDIAKSQKDALSAFEEFFKKFGILYKANHLQVIVLCTMAFTTLMWVFAILRLLIASFVYICYLWHAMGGKVSLRKYCKERIDTRMGEIVQKKHDKALAREKKENALLRHQPTIPILPDTKPASAFDNPDAMSSTSKLIQTNPSPPQSVIYPPSAMPPSMQREPTLPNISEFDRRSPEAPPPPMKSQPPPPSTYASSQAGSASYQQSQTPAPAYFPGRGPPPSRTGTTRTQESYSSNIALMDYEAEKRQQQQQRQWTPEPPSVVSGGEYIPPREAQRRRELAQQQQQQYGPPPMARDPPYAMQPLPPTGSQRTPFVADRIARDAYGPGPNGQGGPQGRFPIQPRGPSPPHAGGPQGRFPIQPREQSPPRSYTAVHMEGAGYGNGAGYGGPPPRSQTAGPMDGSGYGYGPPPARSQTAGPMNDGYGPPPRINTAGPMNDGYGPPPRSNTAGPMNDGYGPPRNNSPQRSHTAASHETVYKEYQQPAYQQAHYDAPQDPQGVYPGRNAYQPSRGPPPAASSRFQPGPQQQQQPFNPPRAGTAPPPRTQNGPYPAPAPAAPTRTATAPSRRPQPAQGFDNPYPSVPLPKGIDERGYGDGSGMV
ncbi:hypothetical protein EDC01DRAFT_634794 [Geopyxis carbonaria]|nr:hypothetical protein EDC01DRAFT_634794 [Geopyxis carbonaria]